MKEMQHINGKIHVVYAGTFDPNKGGSINSNLCSRLFTRKLSHSYMRFWRTSGCR